MKKASLLFLLLAATASAQECPTVTASADMDCRKGQATLSASSGFTSYSWSPAGWVANPNAQITTTTISGTYTVTATTLGSTELVTNGDFSAGNTGFTSGHTYSSVYAPCNYFVGGGWFSTPINLSFPDNTPTSDNKFMSVDGCSPATILWEETMSIPAATDYTFSFFASRADQVQPNFEIHFIGNVSGDVVVSTQAGIPYTGVWSWDKYAVSCWNSGSNTSVTVRVVNLQTNSYGNDFGMDDFSFRRCCVSTATVTVNTLVGNNLVANWDFSAGNTGFFSGHTYSSVYAPCNYFVGGGWFSTPIDPSFPDHTPTSDNMFMSIDGCSPPTILWEQTIPVSQFTIYQFDFWASDADQVVPIFEIHFIGDVSGDNIVATQNGILYNPQVGWNWNQYGVPCWYSGEDTKVIIRIINNETNGHGNDFGLDDFSFRQCCYPDECCNGLPFGQKISLSNKPAVIAEVVPNPSDGNFTLQFKTAQNDAVAELYNALGEKTDSFIINGTSYQYSPSVKQKPGVYMLRIRNGDEVQTLRIVIK